MQEGGESDSRILLDRYPDVPAGVCHSTVRGPHLRDALLFPLFAKLFQKKFFWGGFFFCIFFRYFFTCRKSRGGCMNRITHRVKVTNLD